MENTSNLARDLVGEVGRTGALICIAAETLRHPTWRGLRQGGRLAWAVLRRPS